MGLFRCEGKISNAEARGTGTHEVDAEYNIGERGPAHTSINKPSDVNPYRTDLAGKKLGDKDLKKTKKCMREMNLILALKLEYLKRVKHIDRPYQSLRKVGKYDDIQHKKYLEETFPEVHLLAFIPGTNSKKNLPVGEEQDPWFFKGTTYLVPKSIPSEGNNFRPITGMLNFYKLTMKCVARAMQLDVVMKKLLADNELRSVSQGQNHSVCDDLGWDCNELLQTLCTGDQYI
ncbi:unnamed protein product [Thelazia callipaeda]|uniref:LINE-1 retrotransposable element ORF2 protein n=1 Tax=Thelazia callipaeda TaxID=103827 RepID=A0A0N5DCJ8_THECL|nr:unnamed protein product [Thelazia callipaeda]